MYRRTEGWAARLRLAALSLAGHPDPDRFAADFSGSERTVAECLLAEGGLRGSAPAEPAALDEAAAGWYADHGYPAEAVRHAQAAQGWTLAGMIAGDAELGAHRRCEAVEQARALGLLAPSPRRR